MKRHLVISHYEKDITWIEKHTDMWDIFLYSKSPDPPTDAIVLENIGREPHTYLHHIIENYDNLGDLTIFSQDDPYDHVDDFDHQMGAYGYMKGTNVRNMFVLMTNPISCQWDGSPHHRSLPLTKIWNYLFEDREKPPIIQFGPAMIYFIGKDCILKRPKEFYEHAIKILDSNPVHHPVYSPQEPYCYERLMPYMFI